MEYADKLLDNNFDDSSNSLSDNNEIYESFNQSDDFDRINLDIDDENIEEHSEHTGTDDKIENPKAMILKLIIINGLNLRKKESYMFTLRTYYMNPY